MSLRLIIAVAVIGTFTPSAASLERRSEPVTASQPAFTAVRSKLPDDEPPYVALVGTSADNARLLADLVAIPPVSPRGPRDLLRDYELEMASIAERLSMDLRVISNAVGTGQITKEQGEYVIGERDQVAMMQFQLFSALHRKRYPQFVAFPVAALLFASFAQAKEPKHHQGGTLLQMDSAECGVDENSGKSWRIIRRFAFPNELA